MRITGTDASRLIFPAAHIAKAYGVAPVRTATPVQAAENPARALVAGHVARPVDFDAASPARPAGAALPMYTRAADKIEAAIGVHLGRTIDVSG